MNGGLISILNNGDSKFKKFLNDLKEKTKKYLESKKIKKTKNETQKLQLHSRGFFRKKPFNKEYNELKKSLEDLKAKFQQNLFFSFIRRHGSIISLVIIILLSNIAVIKQAQAENNFENDIFTLPKEAVLRIVSEINPYTPLIEEDNDKIAEIYTDEESNFITQPEIGKQLEENFAATQELRQYTVEKGDTLASIAEKFNLHVASLLEANGIRDEDAGKIKIGDVLNIPGEDISTSMAWLEKEQKTREEAIKKAQAEAQKRQAKTKKAFGQSIRLASSRITSAADFEGGDVNLIIPISSKGISRGLGGGHTGIDYRADIGTPVFAAASGRVIEFTGGWGSGWGLSVVLNHGGGVTTRYAHLSSYVVDMGETISQGQLIGYSGNTGRSTGPHLHFEERINGRPVNPF